MVILCKNYIQMRKNLFALHIFIAICLQASAQDISAFFQTANQFFANYVEEGQVKYADIVLNTAKLDELVSFIEANPFEQNDATTKKAYLINVYNILVIKTAVQNYPISSPQMVTGFFDNVKHNISGNEWTLDQLEKEHILPEFKDPRLHFVLVCGAVGCPPLISEAYLPDNLDQLIEQQTRYSLNSKEFTRVDEANNKVGLSSIFNWYKNEFEDEAGSVIGFINRFRTKPISENANISYYNYDWMLNDIDRKIIATGDPAKSNVQKFTPSVLLPYKGIEVKLFNNLYTQNSFRDGGGNVIELGERQNFFTGLYQVTYGATRSGRLNLGLEVVLNAVRYDTDPNSSPFRLFSGNNDNLDFYRARVSYLGPRVRFVPFENTKNFSVTSTLQFPLSNDLQSERFLAWQRVNWLTQFFYDNIFGDFQLFAEADFLLRFPSTLENGTEQKAFFRTPVTVFFSYFPDSKSTVNINAQYSPAFGGGDDGFSFLNDFVQLGIGAKYQITKEINLELLYTNFAFSRSQGAGQTFNFGLVFIR